MSVASMHLGNFIFNSYNARFTKLNKHISAEFVLYLSVHKHVSLQILISSLDLYIRNAYVEVIIRRCRFSPPKNSQILSLHQQTKCLINNTYVWLSVCCCWLDLNACHIMIAVTLFKINRKIILEIWESIHDISLLACESAIQIMP